MRHLITVQETFQIAERCVVVAPGPIREQVLNAISIPVELRKPNGERLEARLSLTPNEEFHSLTTESPERWTSTLHGVLIIDVPTGTEIWEFDKPARDQRLATDRALLLAAGEETGFNGTSMLKCDACNSPLSFSRKSTAVSHCCTCGKFNGNMRGL